MQMTLILKKFIASPVNDSDYGKELYLVIIQP